MIIFLGVLLLGILLWIAFSASACLLSPVIRCFSISRDAFGVTLFGLKMWSLPALVVTIFVIAIGAIRGKVAWWHTLIAAQSTYLLIAVLIPIGRYEAVQLLVMGVVLFGLVQLSLSASRLIGGLRI